MLSGLDRHVLCQIRLYGHPVLSHNYPFQETSYMNIMCQLYKKSNTIYVIIYISLCMYGVSRLCTEMSPQLLTVLPFFLFFFVNVFEWNDYLFQPFYCQLLGNIDISSAIYLKQLTVLTNKKAPPPPSLPSPHPKKKNPTQQNKIKQNRSV